MHIAMKVVGPSLAFDGLDLLIVMKPDHRGENSGQVAHMINGPIFETLPDGQRPGKESYLQLSDIEAQHLMDSLYNAGVRPTDAGNTGDVRAHLADMRKLTFGLLEEILPKRKSPEEKIRDGLKGVI